MASTPQRSILITGCSSGIGHAAAHGLARRGWRVFASCRKQTDCDRLEAEGFDAPRLDYQDESTIGAALERVLEATGGRLDAVFNNGAFALPGAVEDLPTDGLRDIFEANFFGWHSLTRRVVPVMRAQGHGRIVQNSSVLGFAALKYRGAYNSTKFAVEGLTDTLRLELHGTGIQAVLIEPGPIGTRIRHNARPNFYRWIDWRNSPNRDLYERRLIPRLEKQDDTPDTFELPPEAVVRKLVHALEARRPKPRYFVTTPTYAFAVLQRLLPVRALDTIQRAASG